MQRPLTLHKISLILMNSPLSKNATKSLLSPTTSQTKRTSVNEGLFWDPCWVGLSAPQLNGEELRKTKSTWLLANRLAVGISQLVLLKRFKIEWYARIDFLWWSTICRPVRCHPLYRIRTKRTVWVFILNNTHQNLEQLHVAIVVSPKLYLTSIWSDKQR